MKALVIFAHPNKNSLNYSILCKLEEVIKKKYTSYEIINLYEEKFDPILVFNEIEKRRDLNKNKEMERYRESIRNADTIYFVYPVWWNDMPAIMKGFIDRNFTADFAYKFKGPMAIGLLKEKEIVIINTMDAPKFYVKLFLMENHFRGIKRDIFKFCGFKKVVKFTFYGVKEKTREDNEKRMKKMVEFVKKV